MGGVQDGGGHGRVDGHELTVAHVALHNVQPLVQEDPGILPLGGQEGDDVLGVAALEDLGEEGVLAREVVQEAGLGDLRGPGDLGQRGAPVAVRPEDRDGLSEDALALVLAARAGAARSPAGPSPAPVVRARKGPARSRRCRSAGYAGHACIVARQAHFEVKIPDPEATGWP